MRCFLLPGDCELCQFFEKFLTSDEELEPPVCHSSLQCICVAEVNDCGGNCQTPAACECVSVSNKPGVTPLHVACSYGHLHVIRFLLERGASVNSVTIDQSLNPLQVSRSICFLCII